MHALQEPASTLHWTLPEWEYVVRLARRLRLLARLAAKVEAAGLIEQVPTEPRRHLRAEQHLSRSRMQALVWAVDRIGAALAGESYPRLLLKGAAYIAQDLPIAQG
ncbi:MAG: nucleotidyltransferase family protein, partial [Rudaea sp.]